METLIEFYTHGVELICAFERAAKLSMGVQNTGFHGEFNFN